ncbi:D-mannonate dehydratase [Kushneria sinocarnis]|uniref:Mannonate dehydratase n=1 Tax=Kushneria sinocarnis TaxID=595502 RepID=A0A420WXD3_9GAMM|nr:mannonate dehydratase [Kushneria sinocarnis]RKR04357.1 D-mannonate dehydratase [Kushneria sinocarnis]
MEQSWRWFGPEDPIALSDIRQAGATGIVTALHEYAPGEVWPVEAIRARRDMIEAAGLRWAVVESIPVSEAIKRGDDHLEARSRDLEAWQRTLENLTACGIDTVCYNFMPVLDWTRTELARPLDDGGTALRFDRTDFAVLELFLLARKGAEQEYEKWRIEAARQRFAAMDEADRRRLLDNVLAGLPGAAEHYTAEGFAGVLAAWQEIDEAMLREHLATFLRSVVPVAERLGMRLGIHPDDPPHSLLGLPRIVSTAADLRAVLDAAPGPANGITFCTGSLGVRADNELIAMAREFAPRIHFAHLRATRRDADDPASFSEAPHLEGDVDMVSVIGELVREEQRRSLAGGRPIPMRPDHGHRLLDDLHRTGRPGYPLVGRLRGLAELRGVERAVAQLL